MIKKKTKRTDLKACGVAKEVYKMIETNLEYLDLDNEHKVILFTSSNSEEGKTSTIANLGITFAESGKKVIIVDCDLRKPQIFSHFNIPNNPGLTNILVNKMNYKKVVSKENEHDTLNILTAGELPPDPIKFLNSDLYIDLIEQLKKDYDYVFIDSPPILTVADTSALIKNVDGVVFVAASGQTKKDELRKAKKVLELTKANLIGTILTKVEISSSKYEKYYDYSAR